MGIHINIDIIYDLSVLELRKDQQKGYKTNLSTSKQPNLNVQ